MPLREETITAIAIGLTELDFPELDPREELELTGLASLDTPGLRTEGSGLDLRAFGARYLTRWREAHRLAVAYAVLVKVRPVS